MILETKFKNLSKKIDKLQLDREFVRTQIMKLGCTHPEFARFERYTRNENSCGGLWYKKEINCGICSKIISSVYDKEYKW